MTTHTSYSCDRCGRQLRGLPQAGYQHGLELGHDAMPEDWFVLDIRENSGLFGKHDAIRRHYCPGCGRLAWDLIASFDQPEPEQPKEKT